MRSPDAPPTVPDPGRSYEVPYIEAAVGPEVTQAAAGRERTRLGLFAQMIGQGRPAGSTIDVRSPQIFTSHPRLIDGVSTSAVGDETALESLPGRLRSHGEWDGESNWVAAFGGA